MKLKIDQVEIESGEIVYYGFKVVFRFKLRKEVTIRLMEEHKFPFVDINGEKFNIKISNKGNRFLKTFNDNSKDDNLKNLPKCTGRDLTKLANFALIMLSKF
jgi:hypothetical protein